MIVKNEEEVLARCLASVQHIVDEIIIVDTGSTDATVDIAKAFGSRVFFEPWSDDFAAARNASFAHATGDYILWIDADDIVRPEQAQLLAQKKPYLDRDVYYMPYDYAQDATGRSLCVLWRERMVRRQAGLRWHYPIHECLIVEPEHSTEHADITITHRRTPRGIASDASRNRRILEQTITTEAYSHDPRIHYYLAKEYQYEGALQQAADMFRTFLRLSGGWPEDRIGALHRLAVTLCTLADGTPAQAQSLRDEARAAARNAIALDNSRAEPYFVLGSLAFAEGDYEEAAFQYRRCLRPLPQVMSPVERYYYDLGPLVQLCLCYHYMGDDATANTFNEQALLLSPDEPVLLSNRALFHTSLHNRPAPNPARLAFGTTAIPGYTPYHLDFSADAGEILLPFADNTIEAIHADHAPEHYNYEQLPAALREWQRVLQPGGELLAEVADMDALVQRYTEANTPQEQSTAAALLYSTGNAAKQSSMSVHMLQQVVEEAGFVVDIAGHLDDSEQIWIRALKPLQARRIGWLAAGMDIRMPQFRLRMYHIDRWLRSRGYRSAIIAPEQISDVDTVVFGRSFLQYDYELMLAAKAAGKRALLDICEDLFDLDFPFYRPMIEAADCVVCCSHALEAKARTVHSRTLTIPDAVEADFALNCAYEYRNSLTIGWIGMGGNAHLAEALRPLINSMGHRLLTIHEADTADREWHTDTWQQALIYCDAAIVPADYIRQPSKSNNRLTTLMALGLPTIASPLDAYLRIITPGENALIAASTEEWRQCIELLQQSETRWRIGQAGKEVARRDFHLDKIASAWRDLVIKQEPIVDIIIPTRNNPEYLLACVQSIQICTTLPHNIIVVNNGSPGSLPALPPGVVVVQSNSPLPFAAAINLGIRHGTAPRVCIANDDIIMTHGWLEPLLECIDNGAGLCNPLSNCDYGWLHNYELDIDGVPLLPGGNVLRNGSIALRDGDGAVPVERLYHFQPCTTRSYNREWVAFFCTVVDRRVLDAVGPLDEEFLTGCEDLDFCRRAAALGYTSSVDERSFVMHFGGVSRRQSEQNDPERHQREDEENHERIALKYSRPVLALHTGTAFEPWTAEAINSGGIGGAETAAAHLAEAFVQCGYRVLLFCPCEGMEGVYNGVEYTDISRFNAIASTTVFAVCIGSRYTAIFSAPIRAQRRYLWVHDIRALDTANESTSVHTLANTLDGIVCVSPWHRDFFAAHYGISAEKIAVIGNAIDTGRFQHSVERQPRRFIYASSPDRGLDTLLYLFPFIRLNIPDAELHVFYGFDNWDKSLAATPDPQQAASREAIRSAIEQPGVYYHGRVGQEQLAKEFLRSDVWFYPTRFWETYCITALEAQMAGVVCICSDLAALSTTVGNRGILLAGDAYTAEYRREAVQQLCALFSNEELKEHLSTAGRSWAESQTWEQRAREWVALFHTSIAVPAV